MATAEPRRAVRVLLMDEADRVLLVRFHDGDRTWRCTPGGGIDPGESAGAAARRELREELGLADVEIGPCVWVRRHAGTFHGQPFDQVEAIHFARVAAFEPRPAVGQPVEHAPVDVRWWTVAELLATNEDLAPRALPRLVVDILRDGLPPVPIDAGT